MFSRPPRAGTPDARLHLVVDQQRADLFGVGVQGAQKCAGGRNKAAFTGDRLD